MNAQKVMELSNTCRKTAIFTSPESMAFPGLYNEVAHVSTEPTTVPTAAVLTHVLHTRTAVSIAVRTYLLYLLLYLLYLL